MRIPGATLLPLALLAVLAALTFWLERVTQGAVVDGGKTRHDPDFFVENFSIRRFSPEGLPAPPHQPNNRKHSSQEEEKRLRAIAPEVEAYLDFALRTPGLQRHQFVRRLFALSRKMTPALFIQSLQRAAKYQITRLETIERIAVLSLSQGAGYLPFAQVHEHYQEREAYQEGSLTEKPDLSIYENPPPPDDE